MSNPSPVATLVLSEGSFDQDHTFRIRCSSVPRKVSLQRDYQVKGDGIYWALNSGACLQSSHSEKDVEERERLAASTPLANGDIVEIDGDLYRTRVLGNFSNCALFDPIV